MKKQDLDLGHLVPFVGLYAAYVGFLHAVPGPWRNWKKAPNALDTWTLTHIAWGALGQRMGLSGKEIMALGTINEAIEFYIRRFRPDLLWGSPETARNVLLDLAATYAGWGTARALGGPAGPRRGK